jgi:hypothetical protein
MLSPYLITASERNGSGLPEDYKGLSSIPKSATGSTKNKTAKFIGTLQESNPSTCLKPDTEWLKHECKRGLFEFHDV